MPRRDNRRRSEPALAFVTRRYPPSVGGMETLAAVVHATLRDHGPTALMALGGSPRHLTWFAPWAALRLAALRLRRRLDHVVCGDALMLLLLHPVLVGPNLRVTVMVHGLDLTFRAPGYRRLVRLALRRAHRVVANSRATAAEAASLGVPVDRLKVVPPGLPWAPATAGDRARARAAVLGRLALPPDAVVVTTVGRLVPRKGVAWFVTHVLPRLPAAVHYLVAGDGPERGDVERAVARSGCDDRVHLLGAVPGGQRDELLRATDVFVMPNVAVPGTMEGFGLVAVEAAMAGAVVVAARLEGIPDALDDGRSGYLCPPGDAEAFAARIAGLAADPGGRHRTAQRFQRRAAERFSARRYGADLIAALSGRGR